MFNRPTSPIGRGRRRAIGAAATLAVGVSVFAAVSTGGPAVAAGKTPVIPNDLLVSRVHYAGAAGLLTPGVTVLPTGAVAVADGSFAHVWDNVSVDPNFGITAPIYLD